MNNPVSDTGDYFKEGRSPVEPAAIITNVYLMILQCKIISSRRN